MFTPFALLRRMLPSLGLLLMFGISGIHAQEESAEEKQYREDYDHVQKIVAIGDLSRRADQLFNFMKERPNSKLSEYAQNSYLFVLEEYLKAEKHEPMLRHSERFVKFRPQVGEGYYFYGYALRNLDRIVEAMNALAKCSLIRNPAASKARKFLEVVYKSQNKGSLVGLDKILKKARADLGK